jgi:hypothetical protein
MGWNRGPENTTEWDCSHNNLVLMFMVVGIYITFQVFLIKCSKIEEESSAQFSHEGISTLRLFLLPHL